MSGPLPAAGPRANGSGVGSHDLGKFRGSPTDQLCAAGNADGLGETRRKELVKSGMQLGLRDEDDVFVVDNPCVALSPFQPQKLS